MRVKPVNNTHSASNGGDELIAVSKQVLENNNSRLAL